MFKISPEGLETLKHEEGCVLRTYRDVVGVPTIGYGFTARAGIIKPTPGMRITQAEADRLLEQHLAKIFEPRVRKAGHCREQHQYDASVSFDFNTGAIHRATWVKKFLAGDVAGARKSFMAWRKPKAIIGRRKRERDMFFDGRYPTHISAKGRRNEILADGTKLMVKLGLINGTSDKDTFKAQVKRFQEGHPHLDNDGILGPATLAALQRAVTARKTAKAVAATTVAGGAGLTAEQSTASVVPIEVLWGLGLVALVGVAWMAWRHRDEIRHFIRGL